MEAPSNHLLIRADADVQMGTGHLMRCLALAQSWIDSGGRATFLTACGLPGLIERFRAERFEVRSLKAAPGTDEDADEAFETARELGADWVVLDGYHFSSEFQRMVRREGTRLLAIDDYGHAEHYFADLVLNQNLHANAELYGSHEPYTALMLGPRFALLRREFQRWQGWEREVPELASKVLVTLGGSDPHAVTHQVVHALSQMGSAMPEAVVLLGPGNRIEPELVAVLGRIHTRIRFERNATDMPRLMSWADLAISAGGSTSWELAFMGLPSIAVVIAENQVDLARGLQSNGIARNLGWFTENSEADIQDALIDLMKNAEARRTMATRGQRLVDGQGGTRLVRAMAKSTKRVG